MSGPIFGLATAEFLQKWDRRGPFVHFIAVVASNLVRDRLASLPKPTAPIDEVPDPADHDDPERILETKQLAECLEKAKGRLSDTHRQLIWLRHELGLKHREIADEARPNCGLRRDYSRPRRALPA